MPTIDVIAHGFRATTLDSESVISSRVRTKANDTGIRSELLSRISLLVKGLKAKLTFPGLLKSFARTYHFDSTGQILVSRKAKQKKIVRRQ